MVNLSITSPADQKSDSGRRTETYKDAVRAWDALPALKGRVAAAKSTVLCDEREVSDTIRKAGLEADAMRQSARRDADALLSSARATAVKVREEAYTEGYSAGLNSARLKISEELGDQFEARCKSLQDDIASIIDAIIVEREAMWQAMETEITTVALNIARKIIKTEIEQNSNAIKAVVVDSIKRVTDRDSVRLIVSPDDLKQMRSEREDLLQVIDGIKNLVIDADRRVGRGGCMIETSAGSIDSKVETQLEQVERAMRTK